MLKLIIPSYLTLQPFLAYTHDDIRTTFHPSSGLPPRVDHFEDYGKDEDAIKPIVSDSEPTSKFGTQTEFEFAEVILQARLNNGEVDRLLQVIQKIQNGAAFALRTHNDVQKAWDTASKWHASVSVFICKCWRILSDIQFEKTVVTKTFKGKEYSYEILIRDPLQWGLDLVADPNFAQHVKWDARKL